MSSDGCHGPLGAPEAPPDAHGAHPNPFKNGKIHLKIGFSIFKWVPMGVMGPWGRRRRPQTPMGPIGTHFKMENTI